jgi:hypothetical protein
LIKIFDWQIANDRENVIDFLEGDAFGICSLPTPVFTTDLTAALLYTCEHIIQKLSIRIPVATVGNQTENMEDLKEGIESCSSSEIIFGLGMIHLT